MLIGDNQTIGAQTGNPTYESATTGGNTPGSQTTDAGGAISEDLSSVIGDHTLVQNNIPSHEHFVAHDSFGTTENNGDAVDGRPINSQDGGCYSEYRLKKCASDSDEANVGKSGSWGASGAVTAVTHSGTLTVAAHTHTLGAGSLPPWHAVYYIMYTGA